MTTSLSVRSAPGQRRQLAGRPRKAWLTAHIAFSVGWLGGAYCMLVLGLTGIVAERELQIAAYELMHVFDTAVNIPLTMGMLVTGLVLSLRTKWGLVQHRWVLTKLIASVLTMILAPLLSVPRVLTAIEGLRSGHDLGWLPLQIVAISTAIVAVLTAITAVSVFKPWGRTRWAVARGKADRRPTLPRRDAPAMSG